MFCTNCGYQLQNINNFCPECGNKIKINTPEITENKNTGTAKIIINRAKNFVGSRVKISISIDDNKIGTIKNGTNLEADINFGQHVITLSYWSACNSYLINITPETPIVKFDIYIQMGIISNTICLTNPHNENNVPLKNIIIK